MGPARWIVRLYCTDMSKTWSTLGEHICNSPSISLTAAWMPWARLGDANSKMQPCAFNPKTGKNSVFHERRSFIETRVEWSCCEPVSRLAAKTFIRQIPGKDVIAMCLATGVPGNINGNDLRCHHRSLE
jgi:hypothetical protein